MTKFTENDLSMETQWRSIILFGKNVATYKFAFGRALLDLAQKEKVVITLDDLAEPFAKYMIEHVKNGMGQGNKGRFISELSNYIAGEVDKDAVLSITRKEGFKNVINAFQNVSGAVIPKPFYDGSYIGLKTKLTLTDELLSLKESVQFNNFGEEVEARWRLVETAWGLKLSPRHLEVQYDEVGEELFIVTDAMKRIDVSNARDALNGYQKGKCFYCCDDVSVLTGAENVCQVDHVLPHTNKLHHYPANINGVWNLVLSCRSCNGAGAKGSKIPKIKYLEKLSSRNEYYISSKHPLAETIMNQTGANEVQRNEFLQSHYTLALDNSLQKWEPEFVYPTCP